MTPVTKPFLPPVEQYKQYVDAIWERNWLTNDGPLLKELEEKLRAFLSEPNLLFLANGTVAIQMAIKALDLKGEIITTPFSYVATTSSIVWENCKPVFVDIDAQTFNIDPDKIEQSITSHTTAILATHVFGNPCEIDKIEVLARKHDLSVIYDAAHCFGTTYHGKSVMGYGDISTISFHATKLFHTTEGGAAFSQNPKIIDKMKFLRNFGHNGPSKFSGIGINGKNSEFHAAMGLCNLKHIESILTKRKAQAHYYLKLLKNQNLLFQKITENTTNYNCAYFPVIFNSEAQLLKTQKRLNEEQIFPRRYFYPSLNLLEYVESNPCPVSEKISKRVLCLPLFHTITEAEQKLVSDVIIQSLQ